MKSSLLVCLSVLKSPVIVCRTRSVDTASQHHHSVALPRGILVAKMSFLGMYLAISGHEDHGKKRLFVLTRQLVRFPSPAMRIRENVRTSSRGYISSRSQSQQPSVTTKGKSGNELTTFLSGFPSSIQRCDFAAVSTIVLTCPHSKLEHPSCVDKLFSALPGTSQARAESHPSGPHWASLTCRAFPRLWQQQLVDCQ